MLFKEKLMPILPKLECPDRVVIKGDKPSKISFILEIHNFAIFLLKDRLFSRLQTSTGTFIVQNTLI